VEIDKFFIKEKLNSKLLELGYVATREQVIDCLTKGLNSLDSIRLCDKMGLMDIFLSILRGSVAICDKMGLMDIFLSILRGSVAIC
jgi:hypothetical protein